MIRNTHEQPLVDHSRTSTGELGSVVLSLWLLGQEVCCCLDRFFLELFHWYTPAVVPVVEVVGTHDERLQVSELLALYHQRGGGAGQARWAEAAAAAAEPGRRGARAAPQAGARRGRSSHGRARTQR